MSKFKGFGRGSGKFSNFGQQKQIQKLPNDSGRIDDVPVVYRDFRGGFISLNLRDGIPPNASAEAIDIDVNKRGRLVKATGTTLVEFLTQTATKLVLHPSYDGWTELVLFGGQSIGVKSSGATVWTNLGLRIDKGPIRTGLFGDQLIFYDGGTTVYLRKAGESPVAAPGIPAANAYGAFAARLFAGGVSVDGQYQPMSMGWSSTSGDPADFEGPGSGFELLVENPQPSDRVVAIRAMGLGLQAILCRHSVWIGRFTGLEDRPSDFQPQIVGAGVRDEATVHATPKGVIYLSDDGVRLFDGNTSTVISPEINGEILPLSVDPYSASFDPNRNRYSLHTPKETWIYDLTESRWLKLSLRVNAGIVFSTQFAATTWESLNSTTWEALNGVTWQDLEKREADDAEMYYVSGNRLEKLDPASISFFGQSQQSLWTTPQTRGFSLHNLVQTKAILLEYVGHGTLDVQLPDINSRFETVKAAINLPEVFKPTELWLPLTHTGLTTAIGLKLLTGNLEIIQAQLITQTVSPKIFNPVVIVPPPEPEPEPEPPPTDAIVADVLDAFSYLTTIPDDSGTQDELFLTNNPRHYGRLVGPPVNLYPDDPTLPEENRNGDYRAYRRQDISFSGLGGRLFNLTPLGSVSEIGFSCVVHLRGRTFVSNLTLWKAHGATSIFSAGSINVINTNDIRLDITPSRHVELRIYHTAGMVAFTSTALVPANAYTKIDCRLKVDPINGSFKCVMFDDTGDVRTVMLDEVAISTAKGTTQVAFPIAVLAMLMNPNDANTTTDGVLEHDFVIYGTAGLAAGQVLGDVRVSHRQPSGPGTYTEAPSIGGFYGYAEHWKNVIWGSDGYGYTGSPITNGDEANNYVVFDTSGQKDSYAVEAGKAGATSIICIEPFFIVTRNGSATNPNTGRLFIKSGSTIAYSPVISIPSGVDVAKYGTTKLPRWVLTLDPHTGLPWLPVHADAIELGFEATTVEAGTQTRLQALGIDYVYRGDLDVGRIDPYIFYRSGFGYWHDTAKTVVAHLGDTIHKVEDQSGNGRDCSLRPGYGDDLAPLVQEGGIAIRFGDPSRALGGRGAFQLPYLAGMTATEVLVVFKRGPTNIGIQESAIFQLGAQGQSADYLPNAATGRIESTFGSGNTHDCGVPPFALNDAYHLLNIRSTPSRWLYQIDNTVLVNETGPHVVYTDQSVPVIGEDVLGSHFNGWVKHFVLFNYELSTGARKLWTDFLTGVTSVPPTEAGGGPTRLHFSADHFPSAHFADPHFT
jgi:hypothetical protein